MCLTPLVDDTMLRRLKSPDAEKIENGLHRRWNRHVARDPQGSRHRHVVPEIHPRDLDSIAQPNTAGASWGDIRILPNRQTHGFWAYLLEIKRVTPIACPMTVSRLLFCFVGLFAFFSRGRRQ